MVPYNEEGDILYISIGEPQKAIGVNIGDGTIIRCIEETGEVVGLTLLGVKQRILGALTYK